MHAAVLREFNEQQAKQHLEKKTQEKRREEKTLGTPNGKNASSRNS